MFRYICVFLYRKKWDVETNIEEEKWSQLPEI